MPRKSSRRLAGCIAIELLHLTAAAADFQAGFAVAGSAKAIVLQDRRGARAVFAESGGAITQAIADFVAARLLQTYELPRPSLLLHGAGPGAANSEDLLTAIAAAIDKREPAEVRYGGGSLSVRVAGQCRPIVGECAGGEVLRGTIRGAFRMVEPSHGLLQRSDPLRNYPVQAIAIGKSAVVVALGGASALPAGFGAKGLLFVSHANDTETPPDDSHVREAIRQVLARVAR